MTDPEKIAAFDFLAVALVNQFSDGRYGWWNPTPCGGKSCDTPDEALADLIVWAERMVKVKAKKRSILEAIRQRGDGHAPTIGAGLPEVSGLLPGPVVGEQSVLDRGPEPAGGGG